ncbi:MAG: D-tyrosyl-tRNA(Tyr) deacylase [Clostridia bacterium]|nr:D-tyrosyl-tRNA(Tyr) deacylase [Clostridia bacterium]MBR3640037.1 D-tyrosyl-tRNA(Tyr) deacylase [Clostridia bacterium]
MKVVLQRVLRATVSVDGVIRGSCGRGFLALVGVEKGDCEEDARVLSDKIAALRVFEDDNGKMNLSVRDVGGSILSVSNFTLSASCRRGNRPDFTAAAPPDEAEKLYDLFSKMLSELVPTEKGVFGADMKIDMIADGPVTVPLDSETLRGPRRK